MSYTVVAEHCELQRSCWTLSDTHRRLQLISQASLKAISHDDRGDADEHRLRRLRGQRQEGPSQASRRALRGRGQSAGQDHGDRHGEPEEGAARGAAHGEARRAVAVRLQPGVPPRLRAAGRVPPPPGQARSGSPRAPLLQQRAARHQQRWRRRRQGGQLLQLPRPRLLRLGPARVLRPRAARRAGRRAELLQR